LVLIIFSFAFGTGTHELRNMMPGIIWVAFIFSGLMGLNRTFGSERDKGTLPGLLLCPISPWGIYLAKMIGVFIWVFFMFAEQEELPPGEFLGISNPDLYSHMLVLQSVIWLR
jgi:heme exporter protein B